VKCPPGADFTPAGSSGLTGQAGQAEDRVKKIEVEILLIRLYFVERDTHLKVSPDVKRQFIHADQGEGRCRSHRVSWWMPVKMVE
jgi:hypothetical protein